MNFTFTNFFETKEENTQAITQATDELFNPSQAGTTKPEAVQQCSLLYDYITSQGAGVHLPSSRA